MKVLIADGNRSALDVLAFALHRCGHSVITATNGVQAIERWRSEYPDVIVLDVALPQLDGFSVCQKIRREIDLPGVQPASSRPEKDSAVILVGSDLEDGSVERAFRSGADDYVSKPFSHRQLTLRVEAVSRRNNRGVKGEQPAAKIRASGFVLDTQSHEVSRNGVTARLTPTEFRVLHMLMANAGRVVPSKRLVEYASNYDGGDPTLLRIYIYRIRQKLRMQDGESGVIESVPWIGYRLTHHSGRDNGATPIGQEPSSQHPKALRSG